MPPPSANNPQEFMTKAAQAIPAEVHMFRYSVLAGAQLRLLTSTRLTSL
jgi:hypothetical protein